MEKAIIERLHEILALAEARKKAMLAYGVYESICRQVEYVSAVASGQEFDRIRLREINVGVYAIREFEGSDPEFAIALKDTQFIAHQMAKSLKVSSIDLSR